MNSHSQSRISDALLSRIFDFSMRYPKFIFFIVVMITFLCASGIPRVSVDTTFTSLIPTHDKNKIILQQVSEEFGSDDKIIFYLQDDDLWNYEKLKFFEKLHYDFEQLDIIENVNSLINLKSIEGNKNKISAFDLFSEIPKNPDEIKKILDQSLNNPILADRFISTRNNALVIVLTLKHSHNYTNEQINALFNNISLDCHKHINQCIHVSNYRINSELNSKLFLDLKNLAPISIVILVLSLAIFIKNKNIIIIPLLMSLISIIWAIGLMGWLDIPLNILTAMLPSLVMVIGSTEDTHLITSYIDGLQKNKFEDRQFAIKYMLRYSGIPLLLTVLTTVLGFASNIFSDIALIRDFSISISIALLANGLITLLMVPVYLQFFGKISESNKTTQSNFLTEAIVNISKYSNDHFPGKILFTTALLCIFFIYQASSLYVTNDPLSYLRQDQPLIQDIKLVQQDFAGMKTFYISLESETDKAFLEPKNLSKIVEIQEFIKKQGVFDDSLSITDYLSLINREINNGNNNAYRLPVSKEMVSQYLMFFHRSDIQEVLSIDYRKANILVRHNISDSRTLNHHIDELINVTNSLTEEDLKIHVVGENLIVNRAADSLLNAQINSLGILLLVIFIIMSVLFTSFKGGFIALIPALIPIIIMFGLMGLMDINLNPGTVMVAVIAIGLAIDGTIHILTRYNALCRHTKDTQEAVNLTIKREALPLVATSFSLAAGFAVLQFSNFTLIAQFGLMSAITILLSIFSNLLITPIIMKRVRLVGLYDILSLRTRIDLLQNSLLFKNMTNYQIKKAILISEYLDVNEGETIIHEGNYDRSMYFILKGTVKVIRNGHHVADMGVGDVLGEIGFVRETYRTANVIATEPVQVLRFDFERIQKDLKYFPNIIAKINFNISCILGDRLAEVMAREMQNKSAS